MIIKSYELNKINLEQSKFVLFYGKNEGLKNESTNNLLKNEENITKYEEKEIFENINIFLENVFSKSLFENEKILIIKRVTDKILRVIEEIEEKNIEDVRIILNADVIEKKSKLRSFFEKSKKYVCVAFYPDTNQILSKLTYNFFNQKKISISPANINLIVNKCNGDRSILNNELDKIVNFNLTNKKMTTENLLKLINLAENYSIAELIDNCLAKNYKKTNYILNENNFTSDDCVAITRTIINKSKKLLILSKEFEVNKNLDQTISNSKPPIFWKDKEIVKKQLIKWKSNEIKELIYELLAIELQVKKNNASSLYIISNFILEKSL